MIQTKYTTEVKFEAFNQLKEALEKNISQVNKELQIINIELCKIDMIKECNIDISCYDCLKYPNKKREELETEQKKFNNELSVLKNKLTVLESHTETFWDIYEI